MTKKDHISRPAPKVIPQGDMKLMGLHQEPEPAPERPAAPVPEEPAPRRLAGEGSGRGRKPSGAPLREPLGVRCLPSYGAKLEKLWNRRRAGNPKLQKGQVVEEALDLLFKKESM